jgi:glutaredoxin 3
MEIVAYTLPTCSYCSNLKELFRRAKVEYTEVMVRKDITVEEFQEKYPSVNVFPFVVIDNQTIGGLVETIKVFLEKELIEVPNKK